MNNQIERRGSKYYSPLRFSLDNFFDNGWMGVNAGLPAVNVSENENSFSMEVVAPGFKKEDFKLKVEGDILTVTGEAKSEANEGGKNGEYTRHEYSCSSFTRSFTLPDNVKEDSIKANYSDGILKLRLPKSKAEVKATKEIAIQ